MEVLEDEKAGPFSQEAEQLKMGVHDPFAYLNQVVNHNLQVEPYSVHSLENNLLVNQILEAAKHSAKTSTSVIWEDFFKS